MSCSQAHDLFALGKRQREQKLFYQTYPPGVGRGQEHDRPIGAVHQAVWSKGFEGTSI